MLSQFDENSRWQGPKDGKGRKKVRRRNVSGKVNEIQREKFREKGAEQRARAGDKAEFAGDLTVHSRP